MSGQSFINKFWSQSVPTFVAESQTITMFESKQSQHYCPIIGTKNIECDNKCLNMLGNASHTSSQCIQCIPHKHLLEYIGTELRHQCLCRTFRSFGGYVTVSHQSEAYLSAHALRDALSGPTLTERVTGASNGQVRPCALGNAQWCRRCAVYSYFLLVNSNFLALLSMLTHAQCNARKLLFISRK